MKIKVNSKITICDPSKDIIQYCKDFLTIKNPDIQRKRAMRILYRKFKTIYISI